MNSSIQLCPKCNNHTNIQTDYNNIHFICQCGYNYTMNVNKIISHFNHNNKPNKTTNNNTFSDIITDINKGNEHLSTYFKTIKDEHINTVLSTINKIEASYEVSYNRNMNMLSFLQILINNYDGSTEMMNNILKNRIIIDKCKDNANVDDIIKYYNKYNIIEQKIIINEEVKCIKTITSHYDSINSLLLLKDKRIASCSRHYTIRIFDPSNDYHCDQVIERHSNSITSICELEDGTIVSCSADKSIKIGNYTIRNAHDEWINKVITLPNNRIASSSDDSKIKIWKSNPPYSNPPYSNTPIKVLEGHNKSVRALLYIKERDIMISGSEDKTLRLWNMSTYQCDKVIKGVLGSFENSLYQIDKDRVIVGGNNKIYIVNIDKCAIEKKIENESFGYVYCFLKLRDNKTILCGCDKGIFCFYDMKTEEYTITKKNHKGLINDLLLININTFLSCSFDKTIRIWKY